MRILVFGLVLMAAVLVFDGAFAQQAQVIPLTDWRAAIDGNLSKVSCPRDAHAEIFNILQVYERQAQMEKMRQSHDGQGNPVDAQGQRHLAPPAEPPK